MMNVHLVLLPMSSSRAILVGLLGFVLAAPACAGRPGPGLSPDRDETGLIGDDAPQHAPDRLSAEDERDLRFYGSILANPANDLDTRAGAAERLLAMGRRPAIGVLDEGLRQGDTGTRLAILSAMGNRPSAEPALLDAAVAALATADPTILDSLAINLAKYEDAGLARVTAIARDTGRPLAERRNAVLALGSFPRRESVSRLIELADPARREDEAIRAAAFAGLRRLAPADLGDDFAAWRRWWNDVADKSPEEWARSLVEQYQRRLADLERENDEIAQGYVELLGELYRQLDVVPDQIERLPADLAHPLAPVRQYAMTRIERLLRDSEPIPETLRTQLAARLDDERPELRLQAARLLDELDDPAVGSLVTRRLSIERDRTVTAGLLDLLASHPTPAAHETIRPWLADVGLAPSAGRALWAILLTSTPAADANEATLVVVRRALDETAPSDDGTDPDPAAAAARPVLLRLIAFMGTDADLAGVEPLLDDPRPEVRAAVAEGLCTRDRCDPVLDRAADETVYPFALRSLANGPADLASFERLVALRPSAANRAAWEEAVRDVAARLDPNRLVEADRTLAATEYADVALRTLVLTPAAVNAPEGLALEQRVELLLRLTPMLIEQGEALRAHEILDDLNGTVDSPELTEWRFRAAALTGHYDDAALIHDDPGKWIELLDQLAPNDAEAALRLREAISRRFQDRLVDDVKTQFDAASAKISPSSAVVGSNGDDGDEP
jgi:hypothetical protein